MGRAPTFCRTQALLLHDLVIDLEHAADTVVPGELPRLQNAACFEFFADCMIDQDALQGVRDLKDVFRVDHDGGVTHDFWNR